MKVALASDHAGYDMKMGILEFLSARKVDFKDFGCFSKERSDYVDFAAAAMEGLIRGEYEGAILVCGTGLGMAIVANKYPGVRATPCCDEYMAEMSRSHNDSNCLTLGGRFLPLDEALRIVEVWLSTGFEAGRHQKRLDKICTIERQNFKKNILGA
jgi:ribose 5-phosphate isomerase B